MGKGKKLEIRISKSETNSNDPILKFETFVFGSFGFWTFVLVSDFVLRIYDFLFKFKRTIQ